MTLNTIIFITLNIIFVSLILTFIYHSATGTMVYEQAYAKQIVLLMDSAKPGTTLSLDFAKGVSLVKDNDFRGKEIVKIDDKEHAVIVQLAGGGGYSMKYFSDYSFAFLLEGNTLKITVTEAMQNVVK